MGEGQVLDVMKSCVVPGCLFLESTESGDRCWDGGGDRILR